MTRLARSTKADGALARGAELERYATKLERVLRGGGGLPMAGASREFRAAVTRLVKQGRARIVFSGELADHLVVEAVDRDGAA